ncbi:MAG: hypothetical protein Q9212_003072 [Teloschistes hypoglaucus]
MSYLLFYRRLFHPALVMRRLIDLSILLLLSAYVALFFWNVFLCIPIKKSWIRSTPGHCGTPKVLPYTAASVNMLSDLYILILPIPCIWALNMKIKRRLRVLSVFGLGAFVCATSIVRLTQSSILYSNADLSWNASRITIYSVLEVNVGIICASLLAFPAFLDRYNKLKLPTSLRKLLSSFSSLRRKSTTSHDVLGVDKPAADLQKSRSGEIMLKADNYAWLAKKKNSTETTPSTTLAKTSNREWTPSNSVDTKHDDSLELVDSRGQLALQTSYPDPPAAHVSARDAYERTNSIALHSV